MMLEGGLGFSKLATAVAPLLFAQLRTSTRPPPYHLIIVIRRYTDQLHVTSRNQFAVMPPRHD